MSTVNRHAIASFRIYKPSYIFSLNKFFQWCSALSYVIKKLYIVYSILIFIDYCMIIEKFRCPFKRQYQQVSFYWEFISDRNYFN